MAGSALETKYTMPFRWKAPVTSMVKLDEVPDYDAWGTMRQERIWKRKHFRYRRRDIKAAFKRKAEAAKKAKKAAKGKKVVIGLAMGSSLCKVRKSPFRNTPSDCRGE